MARIIVANYTQMESIKRGGRESTTPQFLPLAGRIQAQAEVL